ncbi:MAG: PHP domain-containing protein [Candidatus Bathyarchaeota archaeon]|nr:PHP domain-containing protein [Candidatus Bathyarchaeota archaeon]
MMIDLHIHSHCSDGSFTVKELFLEARVRHIRLMSITDHDSIDCQEEAVVTGREEGLRYVPGVELNTTFLPPAPYRSGSTSLDLLGYQFDIKDKTLKRELQRISDYREERAARILKRINVVLVEEGMNELTKDDLARIKASADGVLGRPHMANYLVNQGIVGTRQEAFDKYLVRCNVPKYPLHLEDASKLVRGAQGIVVLAHPNDPHGTSLAKLTESLKKQTEIVKESILAHIDGVECWHSRNDALATSHYVRFAEKYNLIKTGGSDCHQKPILMGTVQVPEYVSNQFDF